MRAKGKLAATSRDWKTVLTNSHSKAHGCQGSGSTLGLSRKQLAHELREGSGALRDETHPADSNFLQTETRGRQMSIDVHPSLRRCLEKKKQLSASPTQLHHGGGGAAVEGHTLRAKGKLAATSRDRKPVLTNSQFLKFLDFYGFPYLKKC